MLRSERTWQLLAGVAGVCCPTKLAGEACNPAELPLPCPNPGSGTEQARLSGKLRLRSCTAGPSTAHHSMLAPMNRRPDRVQLSSRSTRVQLARHGLSSAHDASLT